MKIVQILIAPNDATWPGRLLGLGDDGVVYNQTAGGWEPAVPCKVILHNDKAAKGEV